MEYSFGMSVAEGLIDGHSFVRKFGRNPDVDTTAETVWTAGGIYTFPTAAETLEVVSADAADTSAGTGARTVEVFGLDTNFAEQSETVTLNGITPVATSNTYLRCYRAVVRTAGSGGENAGTITIDQQTSSTVVAEIAAGVNQTQLGAYTVPNGYTAHILGLIISVTKNTGVGCDVDMLVRPENEVFQVKGTYGCHSDTGSVWIHFESPIVLEEHTDIRFDATCTSVNGQVAVEFPMCLVLKDR